MHGLSSGVPLSSGGVMKLKRRGSRAASPLAKRDLGSTCSVADGHEPGAAIGVFRALLGRAPTHPAEALRLVVVRRPVPLGVTVGERVVGAAGVAHAGEVILLRVA